jgi:hypothetical protein
MRDLAERLIAYEARGELSAERPGTSRFPVCDRLGPHLMTLMGTAGFRALLSRALALACEQAAWLRAVHVKGDGSMEGLDELHARLDPDEFMEGRTVLVAQLLGLLVAFVGENVTLRLVREVWPEISLNNLNSTTGETSEKAK